MAETETATPAVVINMQYMKDLSFENPNAPVIYSQMAQTAPDLNIDIDVRPTRVQDRTFEVVLNLQAKATVNDKAAFLVELDYAGLVTIGEQVTAPEDIQFLIMVEAPRHLFPFARQILADATRNGGFPPLVINPVDFSDLYKRRMEQAAAAAQAQAAAGEGGAESNSDGGPGASADAGDGQGTDDGQNAEDSENAGASKANGAGKTEATAT